MGEIDGGEILVRMLMAEGVACVFTLHGGHLDAIYQSAVRHGLRLVDTRHEQAAGHAADGWARTTGRVGVAIVTAGPGVTDVVTAVANAYLDCVPVLVIGGRSPLLDDERLPLQGGFSQVDLMKPVTKWSATVTRVERLSDYVAQALRIATSGRPGPVFIELPADVVFARIDESRVHLPVAYRPTERAAPEDATLQLILDRLASAQRPVIMAGGGVWFSGASDTLRVFAERTGIPVLAHGKGRGCISEAHPLSGGGFMSLVGSGPSGGPDVVLLLGARLGLFTGGAQHSFIPAGAHVIQVDIEGEEIGRNRDVQLGVVADCRATLRALADAAASRPWPDRAAWTAMLRSARHQVDAAFSGAAACAAPIHPYRLARDIGSVMNRESDVLVGDGGETAFWLEIASTVRTPGHWLSHGYLGCLGTGLPFAIAAQIAHPGSRVLCLTGDGSVGLNFAEFDTMARHKLPVVVVVNNDRQWGMSKHGQDLMYGKGHAVVTELGAVRYDRAAAGFGCHGEHVERADDVVPAIERAFASGLPACINVATDAEVIAPVTLAMVSHGGAESAPGTVSMSYYGEREVV
ncbi:MAG TPA: thiamine pyrophosphate-binding protein [Dehalococcoidia bacterium]|nr:thiamine pyrophosphate-binding protein [Dehalococcoidia bacterium]